MFQLFKKNFNIYSPVLGKSVPLEEVPDKIFSEKMLGDGLAFEFDTNIIFSPCDGEIVMIAPTKHALGIKLSNKIELMIHIGLEAVNLGGAGFEVVVAVGDKVKRGQTLVKLDRQVFEKEGINLITPMVVTSKNCELKKAVFGSVNSATIVMEIY